MPARRSPPPARGTHAPFDTPFDPTPAVAATLRLPPRSVAVVVGLLDDGNTVPFIARYRKEATGNLDEVAIARIEEERKTRASVARARGLEPLAQRILSDDGVPDVEAALAGARDIVAETLAEHAGVRATVRTLTLRTGGQGAADASRAFAAFVGKHGAVAVAVGNGTAGRETVDFARAALAGTDVLVVAVSESGASIYSASEVARAEFPDLDLTELADVRADMVLEGVVTNVVRGSSVKLDSTPREPEPEPRSGER